MTQYDKYIKENTPTIQELAIMLESDSQSCCNYCIRKSEDSCEKGTCLDNILNFLLSEVLPEVNNG